MGVNGKQKGNSFERKIANLFSDRFKEYTEIEKSFRRNPDSGSFFGGTNAVRTEIYDTDFAVYGDLICPRTFCFSVECKHYKNAPPLNAIITQNVSEWDLWLKQNRADSVLSGRDSLLIVKYNRTETLAFLDNEILGTPHVLKYKDSFIYLLDTVLKLSNDYFFKIEVKKDE